MNVASHALFFQWYYIPISIDSYTEYLEGQLTSFFGVANKKNIYIYTHNFNFHSKMLMYQNIMKPIKHRLKPTKLTSPQLKQRPQPKWGLWQVIKTCQDRRWIKFIFNKPPYGKHGREDPLEIPNMTLTKKKQTKCFQEKHQIDT